MMPFNTATTLEHLRTSRLSRYVLCQARDVLSSDVLERMCRGIFASRRLQQWGCTSAKRILVCTF